MFLQTLDDDELEFPFSGPTRFEGLESADVLRCDPRALRDEYLRTVQEFLTEVRTRASQAGVDYSLLRTSQSFDTALSALLARRMVARGGSSRVGGGINPREDRSPTISRRIDVT